MADQDPTLSDEEQRQRERTGEEVEARASEETRGGEDTEVEPDGDSERQAGEEAGSAVIDERIEEVKRKAEEMAEREKNA